MKLIVGLGNPGSEYRETRHNIGFLVIDELARRWDTAASREQFEALIVKTMFDGAPVMLAKPLTFMNLSGHAVSALAGYYKVEPADVLALTDDVALPLGRVRARREGGAGGHNGLKSLIEQLGTHAFPRLRIGVGRGDDRRDLADHVLGRFEADERETVSAAVLRAADATEVFLRDGIERVMNAFNAAEKQDPDPAE
jgi:peptidyl-tRNA hydrolase, PTH1 family